MILTGLTEPSEIRQPVQGALTCLLQARMQTRISKPNATRPSLVKVPRRVLSIDLRCISTLAGSSSSSSSSSVVVVAAAACAVRRRCWYAITETVFTDLIGGRWHTSRRDASARARPGCGAPRSPSTCYAPPACTDGRRCFGGRCHLRGSVFEVDRVRCVSVFVTFSTVYDAIPRDRPSSSPCARSARRSR